MKNIILKQIIIFWKSVNIFTPSITRSAVASNDYNVFFIDDSYAYGMFDYIATEFYKASFRHREEFKVEEIIKYDPNIVVFELVEGNLKKVY
ncbi:hypothetical protein OGZ02_15010 [Brachyspira hyodysenteriae]|nr:hypothetical protein [Brachyspira hyodysenteriae]MDA0062441.1 hypothetical protein [Brachyspira hyodysenteriae]MDA1470101.1 hypothetical protein [Brachyspira hyodysenteriae]